MNVNAIVIVNKMMNAMMNAIVDVQMNVNGIHNHIHNRIHDSNSLSLLTCYQFRHEEVTGETVRDSKALLGKDVDDA